MIQVKPGDTFVAYVEDEPAGVTVYNKSIGLGPRITSGFVQVDATGVWYIELTAPTEVGDDYLVVFDDGVGHTATETLEVTYQPAGDPTAAYDVTSDLGQVRLLISDVGGSSGTDFLFGDDEIGAFLAMRDDEVMLAAALALRAIAGNEVQVSKVIKFQDLSTDGAKVSDALRALADKYEEQADDDADIEIATMDVGMFSRRALMGLGDEL